MTTDLIQNESCALCGTANLQILISRQALPDQVSVLKCRDCGLVFLESRAGKEELDPEEDAYWDSDEQKEIYFEGDVQEVFFREFNRRLDTMERIHPKRGTLLDVGCGVGHFLKAARDRGWAVRGLDISTEASRMAKKAYDLAVETGTLEESPLKPGELDAVTLWDVIEHVRRPVENIRAANRLLRVGGILVMKTPNEASLFKQLARIAWRLLGSKGGFLLKYVYYVPHYFSYDEKTMARLLEQGGFEVVSFEHDETPQEFSVKKIHAHYKADPRRQMVVRLLPVVQWTARLMKRTNKLVVYARKVREV